MEPEKFNERERLFTLLVHDITGPLSVAATSAGNLANKSDRYGPLTDSQVRLLNRILRNVHRAQDLIQEMVQILRSEEGFFQKDYFSIEKALHDSLLDVLEITVPNAVDTLRQVANHEAFREELKKHRIFVEVTGKYCRAPFCHDQEKVQQILKNLISNAMKYRRERVGVKISGEADLIVFVEDDGLGIPMNEQEAIFKRFVRLNDKNAATVPGLGLGLAGVRTLVEAMRGEIKLESQEGAGTRFTVRIPPIQS